MNDWVHPTLYWACYYLSMLGLKIIRASEMGSQLTICCIRCGTWAPSHHLIRRLIVKSRKDLKPWDLYLELYHRPQTWQVPRQKCCRCACQISKWCDKSNYQSRGFETSVDITIRLLIVYWNGTQAVVAINYNMTVWILAGNYISFTIAAGLIRLHMPGVKKSRV